LAGQANLVDSLMYRSSMPLASRIVARSHLEGVSRGQMHEYLRHHLDICGVAHDVFDEAAVTAIHQGSGGLFRKANHLARGAIIVAAKNQSLTVSADHVRMAEANSNFLSIVHIPLESSTNHDGRSFPVHTVSFIYQRPWRSVRQAQV
ncbi:MAG: hypothetical protein JRH18_24845, partial [Deltaproteobacteria bacterium]|nr:hypothetical protein [Deltaproteobacteria bacterium]